MRLTGLRVHPLKSGAFRPVVSATVEPRGLADDRSWMVVDPAGLMVSARQARALLHVVADTPATDPVVGSGLVLRAPGHTDLEVEVPTAAPDARVPVRLFSQDLEAVPAGERADAWMSAVLGRPVRLVWCDDPGRRSLQREHSRPGDHTAFADAFPVTVASEASLRRLDDWVQEEALARGEEPPEPLTMTRFRPNLVVDGEEPFAEDEWREVVVGEVTFRVAKPAGRCTITTIDPVTLEGGPEPLRTLARYRRSPEGKTLFAVHLVPVTRGLLRVGDPVSAH